MASKSPIILCVWKNNSNTIYSVESELIETLTFDNLHEVSDCICRNKQTIFATDCSNCNEVFIYKSKNYYHETENVCPQHGSITNQPWTLFCSTCEKEGWCMDRSTGKPHNPVCTCNVEVEETVTCLQCKKEYLYVLPYPFRASMCDRHKGTIAICDGFQRVCDGCSNMHVSRINYDVDEVTN